jgi:Trypsin-like peptidase domain
VPARFGVVLAGAAISLVACSGTSRDVAAVRGPTTSAVVTTKSVLTSIGPSIAYIETPLATGSAVLLDGGYLVTNSHVVDPFVAVTVTLPDGERHDNVPVAGSDVFADIAVLGPITTDHPAQKLATHPELAQGDDVYLIGYPGGESAATPEVTISRGVLSRTRTVDEFHQTYYQTDAAIGGGQSGGALIDSHGRLVGISGLLFADEFALALSSDDVAASMAAIRDHTAIPYHPLPTNPDATSGTAHLAPSDFGTTLLIPPNGTDRTVDLALPESAQPIIDAETFFGDVLLVDQAAIDVFNAAAAASNPSAAPVDLTASPPLAPDTWHFAVPADQWLLVRLGPAAAQPADVPFMSTIPVRTYVDSDDHTPINVGDRVVGTIDSLERVDLYDINLNAGQTITVTATSPQGDVLFGVVAPGQRQVDGAYTDDSGLGLYGTDARATSTASAAGTYQIVVGVNDYVATGYALTVK